MLVFATFVSLWLPFVILYRLFAYPVKHNYKGKHVLIIGGSEGIGKAIAEVFLIAGANVTIMSRSKDKLQAAKNELLAKLEELKRKGNNSVQTIEIDITKFETINPALEKANSNQLFGPIDVLILAAGKAYPDYILTQDMQVFEQTMRLNYLGIVACCKAALPLLLKGKSLSKKEKKQILFVGSATSVLSFLGYGSYAPTKFALKGFSDCLRNELSGTNVSVSIAFPPDTDTPGFEEENKTKPKENVEMFPPEIFSSKSVAACVYDGLKREEYTILGPDFGQNLLVNCLSGIVPRNRWTPFWVVMSPLAHVIFLGLRIKIDSVASKYGKRIMTQ